MRERDLHDQFEAWLRKHEIPFSHDRMDKETTGIVGDPDFRVYGPGNRVAFVEFKVEPHGLSDAQEARKAQLERAGCQVCVAYDLETAIHHLATIFEGGVRQEPAAPSAPPEPKFYLTRDSKVGVVLVRKTGDELEAIRAATPHDIEQFPYLPSAL